MCWFPSLDRGRCIESGLYFQAIDCAADGAQVDLCNREAGCWLIGSRICFVRFGTPWSTCSWRPIWRRLWPCRLPVTCGAEGAMRACRALTILALALFAVPAGAHPGGLDGSGCHNNRKTGDYHCHRGGGSPPPPPPRRAQPLIGGGDAYYPNCAAARAAGAAPVRRGDPGYRPGLDRDDDGVACE